MSRLKTIERIEPAIRLPSRDHARSADVHVFFDGSTISISSGQGEKGSQR
jgi:hypothetical protein